MKLTFQTFKVFLAFILLVVSISFSADAQNYGVKGGLALSGVNGMEPAGIRPGLQLGAYKKLGEGEEWSFKIEFLFTQKGSTNWNRSNLASINLLYAEAPILFSIDIFNKTTLNMGFAPAMFLFGSYRSSEDGESQRTSLRGDVPPFDYSTFIGFEYDWDAKTFLGIRFNYSWVPLNAYKSSFQPVPGNLLLNRTLVLYAGYRLDHFFKK